MDFPYKQVFDKAEETLLAYGSRRKSRDEIRANLDRFKAFANRQLSDEQYYLEMTRVVFYSGFRAATVTARMKAIERHFPGWKRASEYTEGHIQQILADPEMICHKGKITACVENARLFGEVIQKHGSFRQYIDSFRPKESLEKLLLLKEELAARFHYLGEVTSYHFLTNIGLPVLKPDRVLCRIFFRLGVTADAGQLLETIMQGKKFAEATGLPIRYIDRVFVAYGQVQTSELGMDQGICLKQPRCEVCSLTQHCHYYLTNKV